MARHLPSTWHLSVDGAATSLEVCRLTFGLGWLEGRCAMTVLVAYASASGSTRGIAERIASKLTVHGIQCDVRDVANAGDLDSYAVFVVGSAVHQGKWLAEAVAFLSRNAGVLKAKPVWLFSVGMQDTPALGVVRGFVGTRESAAITRLRRVVEPRDVHQFRGAVYPEQVGRAGTLFVRAVAGHFGDFRDWSDVDAWGESIATSLECRSTPVGLRG
jgi:menaquinone-dependent protoporphyrinogen oxidase